MAGTKKLVNIVSVSVQTIAKRTSELWVKNFVPKVSHINFKSV